MECLEKFRKGCVLPKGKAVYQFTALNQMSDGNWTYALVSNGDIVYIGSTCILRLRISQHRKDKVFDTVVAYKFRNRQLAYRSEDWAISYVKPLLNSHSTGLSRRSELDPRYVRLCGDSTEYFKKEEKQTT